MISPTQDDNRLTYEVQFGKQVSSLINLNLRHIDTLDGDHIFRSKHRCSLDV